MGCVKNRNEQREVVERAVFVYTILQNFDLRIKIN